MHLMINCALMPADTNYAHLSCQHSVGLPSDITSGFTSFTWYCKLNQHMLWTEAIFCQSSHRDLQYHVYGIPKHLMINYALMPADTNYAHLSCPHNLITSGFTCSSYGPLLPAWAAWYCRSLCKIWQKFASVQSMCWFNLLAKATC